MLSVKWEPSCTRLSLHKFFLKAPKNVMEGLALGITHFESSLAGIGGCPFAPGATGNICTEDTVHLMEQLGIETGIDLAKLTAAAQEMERVLGRPLPGQVMRAGPRLRRYAMEEQAAAVG